MPNIKISAANISLIAELNDTFTARAIWKVLPIEGRVQRWGDEIYFEIPVSAELESNAKTDMEIGEIAYWPPGKAFCIFFGPTPASQGKKPRAASQVTVIGCAAGDATVLRQVKTGSLIRLEKCNDNPAG